MWKIETKKGIKRRGDYQERIVVFRAVSLGMLGLVGSSHMVNTSIFYQQSEIPAEPKTYHWGLGAAIKERCNGLVKLTLLFPFWSMVNAKIIVI